MLVSESWDSLVKFPVAQPAAVHQDHARDLGLRIPTGWYSSRSRAAAES